MATLFSAEAHRRPRIAASGTPTPDLTDPDAARAWFCTDLGMPQAEEIRDHLAAIG